MCGIVGYVGNVSAGPILIDGLSKLEYRGYDSAGIAIIDEKNEINIIKAQGKLKELSNKIDGGNAVEGFVGIGHTRWATHGEPSENNAHPHHSDDYNVIGVHNGIIENYKELRAKLEKNGYKFYSQTDTEIVIKLIDYYYKKYLGTPVDAINHTLVRIRGSYALALMFKDYPDKIFVARKDSPLILGVEGEQSFIASDVPAILKYTRSVYYIDNLEMAMVEKGKVTFYNLNGEEIEKYLKTIDWNAEAAEKSGFEHFMIKEIHEQPIAMENTISSFVKGGDINLQGINLSDEDIRNISQIYIVACGSAYHVGVTAQYIIEDLANIPVRVEVASEFRYRNMNLDKNSLVIIISQSGETADSLAALREAKKRGIKTLSIVNVLGSSIERESDLVLHTYAGPEIAVATTKAYSAQLLITYAVAIRFAEAKNTISADKKTKLINEILELPLKVEKILEEKEHIQELASRFQNVNDVFFVGRGIDYAIGLEGSLKLKEISYIHSEAYAAGELKHGTISLIEDGSVLIGLMSQKRLLEKTLSNIIECKSRGAYVIGLFDKDENINKEVCDFCLDVIPTDDYFATSLYVIPLQLLSYYVSVGRGNDVDKPRNLAKSVTVE